MDKTSIRAQMKARRAAMDLHEIVAKSHSICEKIMPLLKGFSCVGAYLPMQHEVDVRPIITRLHDQNITVALPYVDALRNMTFNRFDKNTEPAPDALGLQSTHGESVVPDCLIVPLLAFDNAGHRLGYGAGFYDRIITSLRAASPKFKAYGVAYAFQAVETLPAEAHDAILDQVITA